MESSVSHIKLWITGVLGLLTAFWGWFGWLVVIWADLMLADWLIGSAVAARDGKWNSARMRAGVWHKGGMILIACVALVTDWLIGTLLANLPAVKLPFEYHVLLGPLVIVWYVIGELGSLAEHAVAMGAPVPEWLMRILDIGREAIDAAGEAIAGEEPGEASYETGHAEKEARERAESSPEAGAKPSGLCSGNIERGHTNE